MKIIINEHQFNRLFINEARYIDTTNKYKTNFMDRCKNQKPIKNNEYIKVFHGFYELEEAIYTAKNGLSGKAKAYRRYSYQYGMNPVGLFVTTDFNTATNFAGNYPRIIMEFSAKSTDLDTPVWNDNDSYFTQGNNPIPFSNKKERVSQRNKYETDAKNSEYDYVRNSDNKALADSIYNDYEHQALFYGDLNPNMIKRFWILEKNNDHYYSLNRINFIKKFKDIKYSENLKDNYSNDMLYLPNENFNGWNDFVERKFNKELKSEYYQNMDNDKLQQEKENIIKIINNSIKDIQNGNYNEIYIYEFLRCMHPKQLIQAFGDDFYRKTINEFY